MQQNVKKAHQEDQTVQTLIRRLQSEQSDQGPHCLLRGTSVPIFSTIWQDRNTFDMCDIVVLSPNF